MDEVAESTPYTALPAVQPTTRLSEIGHGGQFAVDGARGVPAGVEGVAGGLGRVFVLEARVDVADEILDTKSQLAWLWCSPTLRNFPKRKRFEG